MNCPCDFESVCLNPKHRGAAMLGGIRISACPARKMIHALALHHSKYTCPGGANIRCIGNPRKCTRCWEAWARRKAT